MEITFFLFFLYSNGYISFAQTFSCFFKYKMFSSDYCFVFVKTFLVMATHWHTRHSQSLSFLIDEIPNSLVKTDCLGEVHIFSAGYKIISPTFYMLNSQVHPSCHKIFNKCGRVSLCVWGSMCSAEWPSSSSSCGDRFTVGKMTWTTQSFFYKFTPTSFETKKIVESQYWHNL